MLRVTLIAFIGSYFLTNHPIQKKEAYRLRAAQMIPPEPNPTPTVITQ